MSLFTLEIEGQPIMVFASEDQTTAELFAEAPSLHEDLMAFTHEGHPLWDGEAELSVREAHPEEASDWEAAFARAREDGDADEGERDSFSVFLVEVNDAADE